MPENLGGGLASPRLYGAGNVSFSKADAGATAAQLSPMARPIAQRATAFSGYTSAAGPVGENSLDSEAWHACAGPLVCLPRVGDRVVYFPQGHIERVVASTNQSGDLQIPHYNLPSQIFCRVLNLSLGAYRETDEVYAQMTLVPENEQTDQSLEMEEPPVSPKPKLSMFCKNLTSSDTSTHGGFSVPRRAAEECFPQLDYAQSPPAQELIAKDLHGVEWKFRHIYRGQPRRHLLTTGWSVFVSQKKLVAGDAVLFVRGDNGELRIGVRRAVRSQSSVTSSSLLSSHSMQLGVLAAAAHAVSTKTMFTIFYNPRASPAEFVVPYYKYRKSFKLNLSVGMRFKMRFETEDSSERSVRYMGTITGIADIDPQRWPGSKWRFLKVGWDEHAASERQERVSPWEIEPFIAPNVSSPPVSLATKRLRPTMLTDLGFRSSYDLASSMHLQQVLQGNHDLQSSHKQSDERDALVKSSMWASKSDITKNKIPGRMTGAENYMAMLNFNSGSLFGGSLQEEFPLHMTSPKLDMHQQQLRLCVQQFREQRANTQFDKPSTFGIQSASDYAALSAYMKPQNPENSYLKGLVSPRPPLEPPNNPTGARVEVDEPVPMESFKGQEQKQSTEQDCKLFGFSLKSRPPGAGTNAPLIATCKVGATPEGISSEHVMEPPYSAQAYGYLTARVRSSASQNWTQPLNRTCTKVHKQGAVGRAVDLSKFEGYSELLKEISQLFGIDEVLNDSDAGWQAVYIDNEGDMLLVGDDPWEEFCTSVRSIRILSPAEVQKMTSCRNSQTDEPSSRDVSKLSDQQDSSSSPPASSSEEV